MKSNAQVSFGLKGGLNITRLTDTTDRGYRGVANTRMNLGAFININLYGNLSLQTELLYSGKGEKEVSGNDYQQFNLDYIELPVLAKYTFGKQAIKFYVEGGPYIAYWQSGIWKYKFTEANMLGQEKWSFNDVPVSPTSTFKNNRLDIGFDIGGGALYELGPGNVLLDVRMGYGLTSIYSIAGDKIPGWFKTHNEVISVDLGYVIKIGK